MREKGESTREIAKLLGISHGYVLVIGKTEEHYQKRVKKVLESLRRKNLEKWSKGVERHCQEDGVSFIAYSSTEFRCKDHPKIISPVQREKTCAIENCNELFTGRATQKYCYPHSKRLGSINGGRDITRDIVRMRDNDTCQECQIVWNEGERKFDIHHLNGLCGKMSRGYDSNVEMSGLITLCHKCHMGNHASEKIKAGYGKTTKDKKEAAILLREKGWSYDRIGKVLGMTQPIVLKTVRNKEPIL